MNRAQTELGAFFSRDNVSTEFRVWAPEHDRVEVCLLSAQGIETARVSLSKESGGYFSIHCEGVLPGQLYQFRVDGEGPFPDPYSRFQPFGVHGPSQVTTLTFEWTDLSWRGHRREALVFYELHVGTFTQEGTFDSARKKLPYLADLGITAIELMPIAAFSGTRNWGYDGVSFFAPDASYGTPESLCRFVNDAHRLGLSVFLDVVYNHLGPDGNYLACYAKDYFTSRHHTPWGDALNFDGAQSSQPRAWAVQNARMWIQEFHFDGLRLDSVHAVFDDSPHNVMSEITDEVRRAASGRQVYVFGEDDMNEAKHALPREQGGYALSGVWADDFHHQMRRIWAGDEDGYFADYQPQLGDLARILREGWLYSGQFSAFRGKPRGTSATVLQPSQIVHCIQNHDQIGNRPLGDRISQSIDDATFRAMSALLLLSPYTPLIFMGQEWAATTPFAFFTDFPSELGKCVTEGRRREFQKFRGFADGRGIPDPQAPQTFLQSKLNWDELSSSRHQKILNYYKRLLALRRAECAPQERDRAGLEVLPLSENALKMRQGNLEVLVVRQGEFRVRDDGEEVLLFSNDVEYGGAAELQSSTPHEWLLQGPVALVRRLKRESNPQALRA